MKRKAGREFVLGKNVTVGEMDETFKCYRATVTDELVAWPVQGKLEKIELVHDCRQFACWRDGGACSRLTNLEFLINRYYLYRDF